MPEGYHTTADVDGQVGELALLANPGGPAAGQPRAADLAQSSVARRGIAAPFEAIESRIGDSVIKATVAGRPRRKCRVRRRGPQTRWPRLPLEPRDFDGLLASMPHDIGDALETMMNPCRAASAQTVSSSAACRPWFLTCVDPG